MVQASPRFGSQMARPGMLQALLLRRTAAADGKAQQDTGCAFSGGGGEGVPA